MAGEGEGIEPVTLPRPGHADLVAVQKYGFESWDGRPDIRPAIERSSARETAMRVACCTLGRELLRAFGIEVGSHVVRIGAAGYADEPAGLDDPAAWAALAAPLVAMFMGALLAMFAVGYHVQQIIVGVVLNVLAIGLTSFFFGSVMSDNPGLFNAPMRLPTLRIPVLADLSLIHI